MHAERARTVAVFGSYGMESAHSLHGMAVWHRVTSFNDLRHRSRSSCIAEQKYPAVAKGNSRRVQLFWSPFCNVSRIVTSNVAMNRRGLGACDVKVEPCLLLTVPTIICLSVTMSCCRPRPSQLIKRVQVSCFAKKQHGCQRQCLLSAVYLMLLCASVILC